MEGDHRDKQETLFERAFRERAEESKRRKHKAAIEKEQLANLEFNRVLDANTMNLDIENGHDCMRHPKPFQMFPTGLLKVVSYSNEYGEDDVDGFVIFDTEGAAFEMTVQSISKDTRASYHRDAFWEKHAPEYENHSFEVGVVTHSGYGKAYMLRSDGVTVNPRRKRIITRLGILNAEEELYLRFCTDPGPMLYASFNGGGLVKLPFSPAIVAADYRPVLRVTKPGTALKVQVCSLESPVLSKRKPLRRIFQASSVSDDADCAVICRGRIFLCQRAILSKESPVFRETIEAWRLLIDDETCKSFRDEAIIRMEDGTPEIVEALLQYSHTRDFDSSVDFMALLLLAHKYQISGLVEKCGSDLLEKATAENVQSYVDALRPFEQDWELQPWWTYLRNKIRSGPPLTNVRLRREEPLESIHKAAIPSVDLVETSRNRMIDLPPCCVWEIVSSTDHHTAARASTTCKVFRGIVLNASRMVFARVPERSCCTSTSYQQLLGGRTDVLNWLWEVHSHPQMLDAPRVLIHRVAEVIDVYFTHRMVRKVSVQEVACAAMAEGLFQWFHPTGTCDFMLRLLASIGCVAVNGGYGEGGDYWTCFMVAMSEGRCTVAEIQKLRAFLKSEYALWFSKETALCRVRRIAVATAMSEEAGVCASLLCDFTLTLRWNSEWRWGCDVRVAACALVAFILVDCRYWAVKLRPEDVKKAVDIIRVAEWPENITTCTEQLIEMIRGFKIASTSTNVGGVITQDAKENYKNWKVDYKLFKDDQSWDLGGRVHEVRGLIASLQQVKRRSGLFRFRDFSMLEQHADVWSSYFDGRHFGWGALLGVKLRAVWMHYWIHRFFQRRRGQ